MKRFSFVPTALLAIFALLLVSSPTHAATQVATVVAARGEVQALDAKGKGRSLAVQAPIYEDDTIKTGERSRVQIMFTDNTLISLGNASTMKIAEYRWQPEQKDGALKTQIKEGTFRVMGGALTKTAPQNFKTETPTATIGIRGSMYAGVATADFLSVVFQGGKGIEITNPFGTVEISKPGFGTKVALDKPPLPPMKFTAQELGELNKALGGNGAEEKKEKKEEKEGKKEGSGTKEDKADKKEEKKSEEKSSAPKEKQAATQEQPPAGEPAPAAGTPTTTEPAPQPTAESGPAPAPATGTLATSWDNGTTVPTSDPVLAPAPLPPTGTLVSPIPTDLVKDAVVDKSLDNLVDTVTTTAASTTLSWAGNYRAFRRDYAPSTSFLQWERGTLNASLSGSGVFEGTLIDDGSSSPSDIDNFPVPLGPYTFNAASSKFTLPITYNDADLGLKTLTATTYVAPLGEFFYTAARQQFTTPTDIIIGFLGYGGTASGTTPSSGIDSYIGHLLHNDLPGGLEADLEETFIEVSYYNKRFIGLSKDPYVGDHGGAIFFGTVNDNGTAGNIVVLSSNGSGGSPSTSVATGGSATFYGSGNVGFAFTAEGGEYSIETGAGPLYNWQATGAAIRAEPTEFITSYPTTNLTYTGYMVGVGDNTVGGKVSRIFMNNSPTLSMTVNPTTGVVSGSFSANELLGNDGFGTSSIPLSNITIGHPTDPTKSVYILNDEMAAILSAANDINYDGVPGELKSNGNFLVTAGPYEEITQSSTEYMTWGHWEMAYTDADDGSDDHLFSSQSFFVAGQMTDPSYITNNLLNHSVTGTYDGKAYGVMITGPTLTDLDVPTVGGQLTGGTTHLVINFQNPTVAGAVTGNITFNEVAFAINSAASTLTSAGFTAYVSKVDTTAPRDFTDGSTPIYSQVNGAFYGPTATGVGGNFQVRMDNTSNSTRYVGVFGGSQTSLTTP